MERMVRICLTMVLSGLIGLAGTLWVYGEEGEEKEPEALYARAAVLADGESGRILWEKNGDEPMAMASTTKIMTCLVALENGAMDDVVEISENAAAMPDVQLDAAAGDHFLMEDLLYALMLESENDVAVAIAEHVAGSVEGFAEMMNRRASDLGCRQTHFVTPNGLDAQGHQTTAAELAKISAEAIKNPTFVKIINTPSRSFSNTEGNRQYQVSNKDAFLQMMDGAFGIKTGFTQDAGYCFVGALNRDGRTYVSVVLGSGWPPDKSYKWQDTIKLMNFGLSDYAKVRIGRDAMDVGTMAVQNGCKDEVRLTVDSQTAEILMGEKEKASIHIVKDVSRKAPVDKGKEVGRVYYCVNTDVVRQFPIFTEEAVGEKTFIFCIGELIRRWLAF